MLGRGSCSPHKSRGPPARFAAGCAAPRSVPTARGAAGGAFGRPRPAWPRGVGADARRAAADLDRLTRAAHRSNQARMGILVVAAVATGVGFLLILLIGRNQPVSPA